MELESEDTPLLDAVHAFITLLYVNAFPDDLDIEEMLLNRFKQDGLSEEQSKRLVASYLHVAIERAYLAYNDRNK